MSSTSEKQNGLDGAKKLDKNDPEFQVGMLAMKTEAGRTTNHAASST